MSITQIYPSKSEEERLQSDPSQNIFSNRYKLYVSLALT